MSPNEPPPPQLEVLTGLGFRLFTSWEGVSSFHEYIRILKILTELCVHVGQPRDGLGHIVSVASSLLFSKSVLPEYIPR